MTATEWLLCSAVGVPGSEEQGSPWAGLRENQVGKRKQTDGMTSAKTRGKIESECVVEGLDTCNPGTRMLDLKELQF